MSTRRSRRLSRRSPVHPADDNWHPLHGETVHRRPPSPSASATSADSADPRPPFPTHLPFAPGSSHTRNRKAGHIPRPPNAFMVFRSWLWNKDDLKNIERDNRNVSRIAGRYWNELSEAERAPFRCMAEQAKARHAQLYPEYKYSPGSQKKPKVSQRRSQRSAEAENERCNKVVDLLLGGVASRDLASHLGDAHDEVRPGQGTLALVARATPPESPSAVPQNRLKRPAASREESPRLPVSKKQRTTLLPSPLVFTPSLPVLFTTARTQVPLDPTPELVSPSGNPEGFVATDDIPHLSLDNCNDLTFNKDGEDDLSTLFPSHLKPGAHSVFSGVKPDATSFVDSCMLGAYTANTSSLATPVPLTDFDIGAYSSLDSELVPLGSPVFTNPFEPSALMAEHAALLGTLDQLFGQSISPLTPIFPTGTW